MSEDVFTDMLEDDPEDELMENSIKSNWQPIETAPKDGPILIAWGTKTTGLLGYDIVTYRHTKKYWDTLASTPRVEQYENQYSGFLYPERGYIILGWMPLPTFP